jgi:hypothetical protein
MLFFCKASPNAEKGKKKKTQRKRKRKRQETEKRKEVVIYKCPNAAFPSSSKAPPTIIASPFLPPFSLPPLND